MSDDLSLFGDDASIASSEPVRAPSSIAGWQVDLLRKALDARGLASMAARQRTIEDAAGRTVDSLRDLTHEEAIQVLSRLGQAPATRRIDKSAWDERDEDTWIDRL